jgi:hypothetical protein
MASYCPLAVRARCSRAQTAVDDERISVDRTPALTHDGAISFLKAKLQRSCERVFNFHRSGKRKVQTIISGRQRPSRAICWLSFTPFRCVKATPITHIKCMLWFESCLLGCLFPRTGKRPHSRRLGWPAPVTGQQLLAILSFGRGFRAPVSARFFPISVSGEGRLVRLLPETSSRNALWVIGRDAATGGRGRLFCLRVTLAVPTRDRVKLLAKSHQAIAPQE